MLTEEGTTHRVNGIIVQPQVYGPHLHTAAAPVIERRKQKIITQELQPINAYISGERVAPQSRTCTTGSPTEDEKDQSKAALKRNFLWLLSRITDCVNQKIPEWAGFNIQARMDEEYLSTINAPATEMKTVHEIPCKSDEIRKVLNLKEIVSAVDQVLYAKAAEM